MKKTLFITLLSIFIISSLSAQSGSIYTGGNVGFNTRSVKIESTNTTLKSSSWQLAPEIGCFLTDNIAVGLMLGIGGDKSSSETKSTSIQPTLYARRFFKLNDNFNLFGGFNLGLSSDKTVPKGGTSDNTIKSSGFGAAIDLGGTYKLSDKFTIIGRYGTLGFSSTTDKVGSAKTHTTTDFGFNVFSLGPQFTVGIYYTLK
ncbi:MAG: outer membrane beta-barrel protein [Saprospiraceae bacterium]